MKKFYFLSLQAIFLLLGISLNAQYGNGIIISNEGNFGNYNASVSYIDKDTQQLTNNIYYTVNNEDIGDVLQNIGIYEDKAYLVVNNSNKVIVVNRNTFEEITTVTTNINQPRYISFANDKYYVTNSSGQNVTVYDIETNNFITAIAIGSTVEEIETVGNHVFVQNGWFGSGNSISVIDAQTDAIIQNIEIEEGINGLASDGTYIYAISSGSDFTHIYKIDGTTLDIVADVRTTQAANGKKITVSDDIVFFTGNNTHVYGYAVDALTGEPTDVVNVTDNSWSTLYGMDVINGFLYTADAMGFTEPSSITVYNVATGNEMLNLLVGLGANGFYANFENMGTSDIAHHALEITVYPNPVIDYVDIKGVDSAKIQVYNISGKLVKTVAYNGSQINMSDLKSGLYFFVITTAEAKVTKKVLVK